MDYEKIGNFIQQKRKEKDLTQKELAKKLYLTDKAVSKWERGLGCPDVSTLEKLSLVLEVSILSILNGEDIIDDNVENAVLKTVNYSKSVEKNKIKTYISNITLIIVFSIFSFLVYSNITHINYLNKINRIEIDYGIIDDSIMLVQDIESNIATIKNSKLLFSDSDKKEIVKVLEEVYREIINHKLYKISKDTTYTLNEVYDMLNSLNTFSLLNMISIIDKYDKGEYVNHESQINYTVLKMTNRHNVYKTITSLDNYQSSTLTMANDNNGWIIAVDYKTEIDNIYILTKYIMEVGVINE